MLSNTFYFYFVLGQPSKIIVLEQLNLWCKRYKVYFYLCIGHFYTVVVCKTWNKTKNFLQMTFIKYSININIRNECFFHPFQQSLTQIQFPNMTNSPTRTTLRSPNNFFRSYSSYSDIQKQTCFCMKCEIEYLGIILE